MAILVIAVVVLAYFSSADVTVIPPTCTEKGYSVYAWGGKTQIKDLVDAKGHDFPQWEIVYTPNGVAGGLRTRTCQACGYKEEEIYHEQGTLPQIYLTGSLEGIGKKEKVILRAKFSIQGNAFDGYAQLKYQGHSALENEKKNYTVKFFADESCNEKQKLVFSHWNAEHKYILKANYSDTSRSRNLICADLWSQMVVTRQTVHSRLQETSNLGAVDGFPVEVYLNDSFHGTYNLTLHKDDDLFSMEDGQQDGIVIINETETPAAFFREAIDWDTTPDWEVEFSGTENTDWLTAKTDAFHSFVRSSSDEEFRSRLHTYVDQESLIDYMIAMYALGLPAHASRDLMLATYKNGVLIASLFDMEDAFGMKRDGSGFEAADYGLPVLQENVLLSGTDSLLWDRMIRNFYPELCARYQVLREDVLSEQNILKIAQEKISAVPANVNRADYLLYPGQPQQELDHLEQIKAYTSERLSLLDDIFAENTEGEMTNENQ